jgi:tagaturonate reductase
MLNALNRTTAKKPQTHPVKVLQFGKGNFLRAFADWMIDIANETQNFNGAVQIVQVNAQATDERFGDQEGLYHVVLNGVRQGKPVSETRLITCVAGVINPFEDYRAYLRTGENADLAFIISNTTEAGIEFRESDKSSDELSETFPGKLTALLYQRYRFFEGDKKKGLTILPCELIEKNGERLRDKVFEYIGHWNLGDDFRTWIADHNLFCNTLVDRIVPGFPKETIHDIWKATGYEDHLVVTAEPFHIWVIEPRLLSGMSLEKLRKSLPFEAAGFAVKFTEDLAPYRTSKVRILNGAHTSMVPVGYLRGLRTVREVIEDPFTGDFVRKAISEEIIPTLDLPKEELEKFAEDTIERFQNPFIRHELRSIALNSISKFGVRVLPTILDYLHRKQQLPDRLLYSFAALILFYRGEWKGETLPLNDTPAVLKFFKEAWSHNHASTVVGLVLSNENLWGSDLTKINGFGKAVTRHLLTILEEK